MLERLGKQLLRDLAKNGTSSFANRISSAMGAGYVTEFAAGFAIDYVTNLQLNTVTQTLLETAVRTRTRTKLRLECIAAEAKDCVGKGFLKWDVEGNGITDRFDALHEFSHDTMERAGRAIIPVSYKPWVRSWFRYYELMINNIEEIVIENSARPTSESSCVEHYYGWYNKCVEKGFE